MATKSEMLKTHSPLLLGLTGILSLLPLAADAQKIDRSVLPVPEPQPPTITELDARNAKAPPRFEVKAPKGAPNVVVVLLDDIGFGQSSAFGGPCKMPALDKLAAGVPGNTGIRPQSVSPLAEILRLNGYSTAAFGKYHETPPWEVSVSGPLDRWPTHS